MRKSQFLEAELREELLKQREKIAELEIRAQAAEERFDNLIHSLDEVVFTLDQSQRHSGVFGSWVNRSGLRPEQFIGRTVHEIFGEQAAQPHEEANQKALQGQHVVYEWTLPGPEGLQYYQTSLSPMQDAQGNICGIVGVGRNITQFKLAEQSLARSEQRLKSMIDAAMDAIITTNADLNIIMFNNAAEKMFGIAAAQALGRPLETFLPNRYRDKHLKFMFRMNQDSLQRYPAGKTFQVVGMRANGEEFPAESSFSYVELHGERFFTAILRDVTERRDTEQALRDSEELFHSIFEHSHAVMLLIDPDTGNIINANPAAVAFYGFSYNELVSMNISAINQLPREKVAAERQHAKSEERNYFIFPHRLANGQIRTVEVRSHPIKTKDRTLLFSIIHDITERRQAEESLRLSEEKYRNLAEELEQRVQERTAEVQDLYQHAPCGYHSLDANGVFVMVNQTELNWLGYTATEILGHSITNIMTSESQAIMRTFFPIFKERGWIHDLELDFVRKDGSTFPVLINATAIYDDKQRFVTSRSTVMDNSEHKKSENALRKSRDELSAAYSALEKAAHAKDEFLANMSHELRTPLNGILGLSEMMLDEYRGPLNEHQRKFMRTIESSGRHLLSLINDILDLSKIEARKLEIHTETIIVSDVCEASLAFIKEPALKKDITIEFSPQPARTTIQADPRYMKQILVNLLSNAVKFTPSGGTVALKVQPNPERGCLDFQVIDTGIGISPQDMKRLFFPFTQVDSSLTRQHEGTGLGLSLVKHLTEMHNGTVSVESEVGKGSRFTISLPWQPYPPGQAIQTPTNARPDAPANPPAHVVKQSAGVILLAEDTETNILTIRDYLENFGYQILVAYNGREALATADLFSPDVILMDIQMPEMDGLEAIRLLRANPRFVATPIIALTALAMTGDRERCLEAGANEYISKPVSLKQLLDLIEGFLDKKA